MNLLPLSSKSLKESWGHVSLERKCVESRGASWSWDEDALFAEAAAAAAAVECGGERGGGGGSLDGGRVEQSDDTDAEDNEGVASRRCSAFCSSHVDPGCAGGSTGTGFWRALPPSRCWSGKHSCWTSAWRFEGTTKDSEATKEAAKGCEIHFFQTKIMNEISKKSWSATSNQNYQIQHPPATPPTPYISPFLRTDLRPRYRPLRRLYPPLQRRRRKAFVTWKIDVDASSSSPTMTEAGSTNTEFDACWKNGNELFKRRYLDYA